MGVRKLEGDRYRLVYGARRLRACRLAGQTRIPATIMTEDKSGLAVRFPTKPPGYTELYPRTVPI